MANLDNVDLFARARPTTGVAAISGGLAHGVRPPPDERFASFWTYAVWLAGISALGGTFFAIGAAAADLSPLTTAPAAPDEASATYAALLDPSFSFGAQPVSFGSGRPLEPKFVPFVAAAPAAAAPPVVATTEPIPDAPLRRADVPLPVPRPLELQANSGPPLPSLPAGSHLRATQRRTAVLDPRAPVGGVKRPAAAAGVLVAAAQVGPASIAVPVGGQPAVNVGEGVGIVNGATAAPDSDPPKEPDTSISPGLASDQVPAAGGIAVSPSTQENDGQFISYSDYNPYTDESTSVETDTETSQARLDGLVRRKAPAVKDRLAARVTHLAGADKPRPVTSPSVGPNEAKDEDVDANLVQVSSDADDRGPDESGTVVDVPKRPALAPASTVRVGARHALNVRSHLARRTAHKATPGLHIGQNERLQHHSLSQQARYQGRGAEEQALNRGA